MLVGSGSGQRPGGPCAPGEPPGCHAMPGTILVVDDQVLARRVLATELEDAGFDVIVAGNGREAWERFCHHRPDLVITDMVMPRSDGIELLGRIRERSEVPVILFSAHGSVETAVAALKSGADDFVSSTSVDVDKLVARVRDTLAARRGPATPAALEERLVGASAALVRLRSRIAGLAPLRTPVLILGEPGTGHDTVARALHDLGSTAGGPFRRIDAPFFAPGDPLPERGVVYLDQTDRLSEKAQLFWAERLRDAAERDFRPYARLLASASEPLAVLVESGRFSRALAAELRRFEIVLPPLRQRMEDVPLLAEALVNRLASSLGRGGVRLSAAAVKLLQTQAWPGGVKQLAKVLERAIAFTRGREIPKRAVKDVLTEFDETVASIRALHQAQERAALLRAIRETGGNVAQAAERLGRSRTAIYRLIAKHGIRLNSDA